MYCPAHYVVSQVADDTWRFDDPFAPGQPGFVQVPVLTMDWNSNSYSVDHIIKRAWYVDLALVEHDWNDWQARFQHDPAIPGYRIDCAVYSFAQHFYTRDFPQAPSTYWRPRP